MLRHVNLSAHAADARDLHDIWDNDLKKCITRRRVIEGFAFLFVIARLMDFFHPSIEAFVAVLAGLVYMGILQFIDESNVNYLVHGWDLREALHAFR
jgi:hypothetical protein